MTKAGHIGNNVKRLRRLAGLKQNEFAQRLGVGSSTISQIESGIAFPSVPLLQRMMEVLGVSADEIMCEPLTEAPKIIPDKPIPANGVRRVELDGSDSTPQIREMTSALIEHILALEDICHVQKHAAFSLHMPLTLTHAGLENLSTCLRDAMRIHSGVLFDYFELFESYGLRVIVAPFYRKLESLSFYDTRHENAFIFINSRHNPEKQLFRLAYELGHLLLANWAAGHGGYPEFPPEDRLDPKHAAAKFAACFLMPAEAIRGTVRQLGVTDGDWTCDLLMRIKHRFGVSAESFLYRLKELGLVNTAVEPELRARILAHYRETGYAEPDDTRRILTPNGRLGDLILLAERTSAAGTELLQIKQTLTTWELNLP